MNIDDKLANMSVRRSDAHQDILRARLLAHRGEATMKRQSQKNRWSLLLAVPLLALLLVVAATFVTVSQDNTHKTAIEKAIEPLTAKQVFASAQTVAEEQAKLKDGQWYYQKRFRTIGQTKTCDVHTEIEETYWREDGVIVHIRRNLETLKLIERAVRAENGQTEYLNGKYDTYDQSAIDPALLQTRPICDVPQWQDNENYRQYDKHLAAIASAYGWHGSETKSASAGGGLYRSDLLSGSPVRNSDVFAKLQSLNEWEVRTDQSFGKGPEVVVALHFEAGKDYTENIYFDQETKRFMGIETTSLPAMYEYMGVIDSGVRTYNLDASNAN